SARRWGDSNSTSVRGSAPASASRRRRSAEGRGRKPREVKARAGSAERTSATSTAEGPGGAGALWPGGAAPGATPRAGPGERRGAELGGGVRGERWGGLGDEGEVALRERVQQARYGGVLVVVGEGDDAGADAVVREELARGARVLGGDQRHLGQDAQGAQRNVF